MRAIVACELLLVPTDNEVADTAKPEARLSRPTESPGTASCMIDRLASMGFYADPELITLLQECAPCCGGALMSAKQAACDVAAMFGVTPRQNLKIFIARMFCARELPLRARRWSYGHETKSR